MKYEEMEKEELEKEMALYKKVARITHFCKNEEEKEKMLNELAYEEGRKSAIKYVVMKELKLGYSLKKISIRINVPLEEIISILSE